LAASLGNGDGEEYPDTVALGGIELTWVTRKDVLIQSLPGRQMVVVVVVEKARRTALMADRTPHSGGMCVNILGIALSAYIARRCQRA
jgi:hypothetical protein